MSPARTKEKIENRPSPAAGNIDKAMANLARHVEDLEQRLPIPFEEFLNELVARPDDVIRDIFQVFYDMIHSYVGEGVDEYPDDPESIHYVHYDFSRLFVEGTDNPFFADRLFSNRLIALSDSLKRGAQQNKIYIFRGPPGCGKSTFLNNFLRKFEEYSNASQGLRYETVWRFDRQLLRGVRDYAHQAVVEKLSRLLGSASGNLDDALSGGELDETADIGRLVYWPPTPASLRQAV